jgi:LytS/YehU family sensor histidine kinase
MYFEKAIKINKTVATKAELLQVLKSLSEIYEQQGDYQRAFETMKRKDQLHEELFGEEKLRLFRNIEQQQEEMLQRERAMELEQKVRQLEHAALLSQMNPHFIFNSLNTLQNLVIEGNEEAAINFISEFSTLMREMLNNAKEELIPLKNEIEFLTRYVQLEEIRFNNNFNFNCNVEDVLPKHLVKIPVMLIQPLLENAIRHGLAPSKDKKSLSLNIRNGGPFILVEVIDNGIGWQENDKKEHKSHALENIKERLSLMRAPNNENGRMEINTKLSQGTQITLWIPVQF